MSNITLQQQPGMLTICIDRADKKNALTRTMYQAMADAIEAAQQDKTCKVIVIKGNGGVFTAGNDISDFASRGENEHVVETVNFMRALADCKLPVIAQVSGLAIGIGTTLLLQCDFVYCADNTKFALPFINLGLVPEYASSYLLPRLIGRRKASELLMLGETFSAQDALNFQLVNKVVPEAQLDATVEEVAKKLVEKPAFALLQTKALMSNENKAIHDQMNMEMDIFLEALGTEAAKEAFDAFLHKRPLNPEKFK